MAAAEAAEVACVLNFREMFIVISSNALMCETVTESSQPNHIICSFHFTVGKISLTI